MLSSNVTNIRLIHLQLDANTATMTLWKEIYNLRKIINTSGIHISAYCSTFAQVVMPIPQVAAPITQRLELAQVSFPFPQVVFLFP
jgi:hypothetical protein